MRLSLAIVAILGALPATLPLPARAGSPASPADASPEPGLRLPVRITAGSANQFLGVPSPDGQRLYFASDQRSTTEIHLQDLDGGGPRLLFDLQADATWPRPSPDGRRLLYLSFRDDATGDACLYDLESGDHRCVTGPGTADVQAMWFPDGRFGVVQRDSLHGDFRLVRYGVDGGAGTVVVDRSLSTPAVSPDGSMLAYLPLARAQAGVGVTFDPRTASSLEFQRLDRKEPARPFSPDLPGATGFPAFSADGKWLYFTQYRNDTSSDGSIDASDHGVVFRVSLDADSGMPSTGAVPQQLTSAAWSCQYPSPGRDFLFVTCSHEGSLDVYRLPLDGSVPPGWGLDRLDARLRHARDPWERLMLMATALRKDPDPASRHRRLRSLAFAEADAGDLLSANHHARSLRKAARPGSETSEADALLELVEHRRDEQRFLRGAMPEARFLSLARSRADRMRPLAESAGTPVPLARLALSEILDSAGDEAAARRAFDTVDPVSLEDPDLVRLAARRAVDLFRADGSRGRLRELYASLSRHPALEAPDRLAFAGRQVEDLLRGLPAARRIPVLEEARKGLDPGSDLAFRLDLDRRLQGLAGGDPEEVRKAVLELYRENKDPDRRRVLALATARRAAAADAEPVTYDFVNTWASGVRADSTDRETAKALYRAVVLDRAWGDFADGNFPDARGRFHEVTLQTGALEAHEGFVQARLAEGKDDLDTLYAKRFQGDPDDPTPAFVRAFRIALDLPVGGDPEKALASLRQAEEWARPAARARPNDWEIHLLRGFLAHARHLRTGDAQAAVTASSAYTLALDLARDSPRARAAVLLESGLLHASLGNAAASLRLLDERVRLPFATPAAELSLRVARARCLFLSDRDAEAADEADRALALVESRPAMAAHLPPALDRAALLALVAGRAARAADLYARLRPHVEATASTPVGALNLARLDLSSGAAMLADARPAQAIDALARARQYFHGRKALPPAPPAFPGRAASPRLFDPVDLEILATSLEARALQDAGRLQDAARRVDEEAELRRQRLERLDLDEDLLGLAEAGWRRAELAWRAKDPDGFRKRAAAALARAREYGRRTGTPFPNAETRVLQGRAAAILLLGLPAQPPDATLGRDLARAHAFLSAHRTPAREADRFRLGVLASLWQLGNPEGIDAPRHAPGGKP